MRNDRGKQLSLQPWLNTSKESSRSIVFWGHLSHMTLLASYWSSKHTDTHTDGREWTIQTEKDGQIVKEGGETELEGVWRTEITPARCTEPNKGSFQVLMRTHHSCTCCKIYTKEHNSGRRLYFVTVVKCGPGECLPNYTSLSAPQY